MNCLRRVEHAEGTRDVVVRRVEQVERDAGPFELPRLVALVAGEPHDAVECPVGERVEAVEQHRLVVDTLLEARRGEHRLDARRQRALHADRRAGEILELGCRTGMQDQPVDRAASFDRDGDEIGVVRCGVVEHLAEGSTGGELRLAAGDDRVVGGGEAGLQLHVQAQLVEVAGLLGDHDLDDRGRRREVEARQVRDRAGVAVGLAPRLWERLAGGDRRGLRRRPWSRWSALVGVVGDRRTSRRPCRRRCRTPAGARAISPRRGSRARWLICRPCGRAIGLPAHGGRGGLQEKAHPGP